MQRSGIFLTQVLNLGLEAWYDLIEQESEVFPEEPTAELYLEA